MDSLSNGRAGLHPAKQARSRRTEERLLRAALVRLREVPFEDLTIRDLVTAAGSSVGAFYKRFRDKDGLLSALIAHLQEDTRALLADMSLDGPPQRRVRAWVDTAVTHWETYGGLFHTLLVRSRVEPGYLDVGAGLMALATERLHAALPSVAAEEVERATRAAFALLDQSMIFGRIPGGPGAEHDALVAELDIITCTLLHLEAS
ncbi:TetR/AcrR family transcriptional regulator [Haliangium sp.]|uniref:TetR/AcrR family transcriptional regulator n=1 Tax=Haliangium sp. TaxID=2663208 RepID=UPI003D0DC92B